MTCVVDDGDATHEPGLAIVGLHFAHRLAVSGSTWKMMTAPMDFAAVSMSPEAAMASPILISVGLMATGGFEGDVVSDCCRRKPPAAFHDAGVYAVVDCVKVAGFSFDGEVICGDFGDGAHDASAHHSAAPACRDRRAGHGRLRGALMVCGGVF